MELDDARAALEAKLDEGVTCPCCNQYARRYRRKLNSGIARALIALTRLPSDDEGWVHIREVVRVMGVSPEMSKATWWGLVTSKAAPDGKKDSGLWRLTEQGDLFVHSRHTVPRYAVVYNNVCERLEGDLISVRAALGDKFDYRELMGWRTDPALEGFL